MRYQCYEIICNLLTLCYTNCIIWIAFADGIGPDEPYSYCGMNQFFGLSLQKWFKLFLLCILLSVNYHTWVPRRSVSKCIICNQNIPYRSYNEILVAFYPTLNLRSGQCKHQVTFYRWIYYYIVLSEYTYLSFSME